MSSISSTAPVTGLVETLRAELIKSARLDKTTQRREVLEFTQELDRATNARVEERDRILQLDQILREAGLTPTTDGSLTDLLPAGLPATLGSFTNTGITTGGGNLAALPTTLSQTLNQTPVLADSTDFALLRLLSANPSLQATASTSQANASPAPNAVEISASVLDQSIEIAAANQKSASEIAAQVIANRPQAIPVGTPIPGSLAQAVASSLSVVQPTAAVSPQGSASSNQDALLAKYGIGQRGASVKALPPNQRNRRSTELEVDLSE